MKLHFASSLVAAGMSLLTLVGYAQTPITSVPTIISSPGKYTFAHKLTLNGGSIAITVTASDVTIDMRGFALQSGSVFNQSRAIVASGVNNLVIENGTIASRFELGAISITGGSGHKITNLSVENFGNEGIVLNNCTGSVISTCEVNKPALNRINGSPGIALNGGDGNRVVNNSVSGYRSGSNGINGITSTGTNYFENDYFNGCLVGISMSSTDKYRAITTTNCITGIVGGIDVDNMSN
jgi:hypothetical protein